MATREDTLEQAELHFTRSMSSRGRYDATDIDDPDDEVPDEEFEATLNNLLDRTGDESKQRTMNTMVSEEDTEELLIMKPIETKQERTEKAEQVSTQRRNSNPYSNPLCKTVVSAGKTTLGYSQAKMLGLVDSTGHGKLGEVGLPAALPDSTVKRIGNLSKPRVIDVDVIMSGVDDEDKLARREAKRAAERAKRDPKCGYDFVHRLDEERGDFLDRINSKGKGSKKKELESAEADYNARLDKLGCPKCKKLQSFDEFYEKRRMCGQCNEKYIKLNLCNAASFTKRQAAAQRLREEKLAALDAELYARPASGKFIPGVGLISSANDHESRVNPPNLPSSGQSSSTGIANKPGGGGTGPMMSNVIKIIADSNKQRAALMQQTVSRIADPPTHNTKSASSQHAATVGAMPRPRPQSAGATAKQRGQTNSARPTAMTEEEIRTMKFNKLTAFPSNNKR